MVEFLLVALALYGIISLIHNLMPSAKSTPAPVVTKHSSNKDDTEEWLALFNKHEELRKAAAFAKTSDANKSTQSEGGWVYEWVDDSPATQRSSSKSVSTKSTNGQNGHTRAVWARMGYQVKYGESPAYTYYGNCVYLPSQVLRVQQLFTSNQRISGEGGHTARVWARKGFKVKSGEYRAYVYYGQEIFMPDQVF
jgi:hypothetical protein